MTNSLLALAAVALAVTLLGLLLLARRWRGLSAFGWIAYSILVVGIPVAVGRLVWHLPDAHVAVGVAVIFSALLLATWWRPQWNPPGQAFIGALGLVSVAFVVTTTTYTFSAGLSIPAVFASLLLAGIEAFAFLLLILGTHELVDVVARVRWDRRAGSVAVADPAPFVSVQVAAHNEPPELVIGSLQTLRNLDYPSYEVIVLENNTEDESLWRPVQAYCEEVGFRFVRLVDWPGFKAGALNHGLEICDPRTEILAFVDADFLVDPAFLKETVGYFADESIAIVQTAQDFRVDAEDESEYLRRLALTYKAFDEITMPSRNERDAIIFAGTMGLIRKSALEKAGGWSEWCVTEDAETSLRILGHGYSARYVERIYGRGVMPLTFAALKKQRFRWCFGGVQLVRHHWRLLVTGRGRAVDGSELRLTRGQRYDYLAGGLQWSNGMLTLTFSLLLLAGILFETAGFGWQLRPLVGIFVAIPFLLLTSGFLKSIWGLRVRLGVSWRDAFAVMGIWLSLSWAITLATLQALGGKKVAFLRTPKFHENESLKQALLTTRAETPLALAMAVGAAISFARPPSIEAAFVGALCTLGALVYAAAPVTALVAARVRLSSSVLRRRRVLEERGPRSYRRPIVYGFATAVALALLLTTSSGLVEDEGSGLGGMFSLPETADGGSELEDLPPEEIPDDPVDLTPENGTAPDPAATAGRGTGRAGTRRAPAGDTNGGAGEPAPQATERPGPAPQATQQPAPAPAPQSTERPEPAPESTSRPEPGGGPGSRPTPGGPPGDGAGRPDPSPTN